MKNTKTTPGPWAVSKGLVITSSGHRIGLVDHCCDGSSPEADARLIAASPELMEAAQHVLMLAEAQGWEPLAQDALRAAIALAQEPS
jgi:hypothetical protein